MELPRIPDAAPLDAEAAVEGKAWCPGCDEQTGYRMEKIEFLGNPVKTSCFCTKCGSRVHPEAQDRESARRLRTDAIRLRAGAAVSFFLILLLPLLLLILAVTLLFYLF